MKDKMYYPDEEYEDVCEDGLDDVWAEDLGDWYADEFPDDAIGDESSDEDETGLEWNDEDFMDYPPSRGRKAS